MSRLIIPSEFLAVTGLFKDMTDKHTADGVSSILTNFLTENLIDLAADTTRVDDAKAAHKIFQKSGKDAEKQFREAKRLFNPVMKQHRKCVQFLKRFYINNIGTLGDWSVTVNGNKIVYPATIEASIEAVIDFIDKHLSYAPGTSPLKGFLDNNTEINLTANKAAAQAAATCQSDGEAANNTKEEKRADRDAFMAPVIEHLTSIGQFLVKTFASNPNTAGEWGYTVDNSPQGTKIRTGSVNISSSKVLTNLVNEGILVNESGFDIELYKGKTVSGTAIILHPGKPFVIKTGYGTVTLRNPNDEEKASYKGVFHP